MKTKRILLLSAIMGLLLLALINGCGDSIPSAPFGSVIAINPASVTIAAGGGNVNQFVSARITDFEGSPLNGIKVKVYGGFASPFYPSLYYFYDETNTTQRSSGFEGITDKFGVFSFYIHIPQLTSTQLNPPTIVSAVSVTGGGTLPAGAYSYQVTAVGGSLFETNGSVAFPIVTTATGAITINWSEVPNAVGYRVYGRTAGGEGYIAYVRQPTLSFTDTDATLVTTLTPTVNSSQGEMTNSFTDKVEVRSGSSFGSIEIKFN